MEFSAGAAEMWGRWVLVNLMREWLQQATRRSIVLRGLGYSAVVGTILVTINQGDILLSVDVTQRHVLKIGLTYTVPYLVSTLSSVGAIRNSVRNG